MKRWPIIAAATLGGAGLLGALAAVSGMIPIAASSGHFALTEWLLVFSKERAVSTQARGVTLPRLDDPALVLKGAGHFETACRPCHGAPDLPRQPRVARAMLPPPPNLAERAPHWEPDELFFIVKNGIKFTGMPAWPSQVRDDEVIAVVAFLRELPQLDATAYTELVHGPGGARQNQHAGIPPKQPPPSEPIVSLASHEPAPRAVQTSCGRCHGLDGQGRGTPAFPALAGQKAEYLIAALEAYASDRRQSGLMQPAAAALSREAMREVATYYSRLPPRSPREPSDPAAAERGRTLADMGDEERRVPSCSDCHGPGPETRSPYAPRLAGQYAEYLELQLRLFSEKHRGGSEHAALMDFVTPGLTHERMHDAAQYYSSVAP
jgi:cytochrome c553